MDVKTITLEYLRNNGFDGLYSEGACACERSDLFPCGGVIGLQECKPGYRQAQEEANASGYDFMIGPDKPDQRHNEGETQQANHPSVEVERANQVMLSALRQIAAAHRFNVAGIPPHEVHSLAFVAIEAATIAMNEKCQKLSTETLDNSGQIIE